MEKAKTTPKDFFLWAGAMVAFYWSVVALVSLIFSYLDNVFPDTALMYYSDPYQGGISYEMASLIILFPLFLVLFWLIHRDIRQDPTRREVWVRRWALMLTLFVAGFAMVVDLIVLLNTFLSGEMLGVRFLLKVLVVLLVSSAVFMHFIADMWGYWQLYAGRAARVGWAAGVLVVITIAAGFIIVGTPWQARQYRLDEQRVSDLQQIQSEIVNYWQGKQVLPTSLGALNDSISGFYVPVDPQTKQSYTYSTSGKTSFKLCADFNATSQGSGAQGMYTQPVMAVPASGVATSKGQVVSTSWQHGAGEMCFVRTIDPQLYPPTK